MDETNNTENTSTSGDGSEKAEQAVTPMVAIIMPVWNEERFIGATLEQIVAQDYPLDKLEIIIADDDSTDETVEIAQQFSGKLPGLKILPNEAGGPAGGRNVGVRNSTAPYIIVIDGHVHIPSTTLISDMVTLFEKRRAMCLCRPQPLDPPGLNLFERAVALARESYLGHNPDSDIYSDIEKEVDPTSTGAMWRREVFEQIGYFDETLDACEDVDFNHRIKKAKLRSWISPKLKVQYYPRNSLSGLWKQMARYGAGRYLFSKKYGEYPITSLLAPIGFAVFAFFGTLTILGADGPDEAFGNFFNIYVLIVGITTVILSLRVKQPEFIFSLPVIYPVIHFGLGFGYIKEMISVWRANRNENNQTLGDQSAPPEQSSPPAPPPPVSSSSTPPPPSPPPPQPPAAPQAPSAE